MSNKRPTRGYRYKLIIHPESVYLRTADVSDEMRRLAWYLEDRPHLVESGQFVVVDTLRNKTIAADEVKKILQIGG